MVLSVPTVVPELSFSAMLLELNVMAVGALFKVGEKSPGNEIASNLAYPDVFH